MVLRLSHLKSWIQKDYIKEYFDKGLKSLLKVYLKLVKPIDSATKPHRQRSGVAWVKILVRQNLGSCFQ
jgi:hypothetical protein